MYKYYLATRDLDINGTNVSVYFTANIHNQNLSFVEADADIQLKADLEARLNARYGVEGWEFVRVIQHGIEVLSLES